MDVERMYLATTSQPDMQLPQKWQAGRVAVGRLRWPCARGMTARRGCGAVANGDGGTLHRHGREKDAVGEIFEVIVVCRRRDFALDAVVVRLISASGRRASPGRRHRAGGLEIALAEAESDGVPTTGLPPRPRLRSPSKPVAGLHDGDVAGGNW